MAQPYSEVQTALVSRLRGNTGVQAVMTGASAPTWNIIDNISVNTMFPYVWVADMQGLLGTALALGTNATDIIASLHIFSQYPGFKEAQIIASAIDTALNKQALSLADGFTNFFLLFQSSLPPILEQDGLTRHLIVRYKLMMQGG